VAARRHPVYPEWALEPARAPDYPQSAPNGHNLPMMLPPPPWAERFASGDFDEVRARLKSYGNHRRDCVGRGPLKLQLSIIDLGNASIGWVESSLGQRVVATPNLPLVHVPLRGALTYRVGSRSLEATPGRAVLIRPGTEYSLCYERSTQMIGLQPREADLLDALGTFGAAPDTGLPGAVELSLPENALAQLATALGILWEHPLPDTHGTLARHLRRSLSGWIAALLSPHLPAGASEACAAARIRLVEEWIDAHLGEPIALPSLCRVAGIGPRGLRKSFSQRRGMSPLQWVWTRRMAAARHRLMAAGDGDSVIRIAVDHGITHAGRFAVDYRRRYGERPSLTLARAQGRP
jgi:AraC-like DNA-binding protein